MEEKRKEIEIKLLVKLFLRTNLTFEHLSKVSKIDVPTIEERLHDKEGIISVFNNEENNIPGFDKSEGYASYGEYIFSEVKKRTDYIKEINGPRINLSKIYSKEEHQMHFLSHVLLTYRLTLASLSELLGMTEDDIYNKLIIHNNGNLYVAYKYALEIDYGNQDLAKENFISLYDSLLMAKKAKDKDKITELLSMVDDSKAIEVMNKRKNRKAGEKVTDDMIEVMLNYQIKYALRSISVEKLFEMDRHSYFKYVSAYLKNNPELKLKYEHLADFNENKYELRGSNHGA